MSIDFERENEALPPRTDGNEEPIDTDKELAQEIYADWRHVRDDRQDWIEEVLMDEKFVTGEQWTEAERKELQAKKMPDYVTNLVFPAIQSALSHIMANSPSFLFTHPTPDKDVTHLNEVLSHIFRKSQFNIVGKKSLFSTLAKSMGAVYIYEDPLANDGLGEIKIDYANIRDIYIPKHCKKWNLSDASHVYYSWLVSKETIAKQYNLADDELDDIVTGYDEGYMDDVELRPSSRANTDKDNAARTIREDSKKEYVRKIVRFKKITIDTRTILNKYTGERHKFERKEGDKDDWGQTEEIQTIFKTAMYQFPGKKVEDIFIAKEGNTNKIEVTVTAGMGMMLDRFVLDTKYYPIVPIYYWDTDSPFPYSFVHFIEQQQKIVNLADSAVLYNAQAGSFPRMMGPKGYKGNDEQSKKEFEENSCLPNAAFEYETDPALVSGGVPTLIPPMPISNAFMNIKQDAANSIQFISGEFGLRQGDPSDAPNTFRGMATLLEHSKDRTKEFGDSIDNWFERIGQVVYDLAKAVYTYPMTIQIPENNGESFKTMVVNKVRIEGGEDVIDNGVFNSTAEIAVKPGSYSPVYKYVILSILETMMQQGYPVADYIVDYIDMPDDRKKDLKQRMAAQNDIAQVMEMMNKTKKDLEKTVNNNINLQKEIDVLTAQINVAKAEGKMLGDIEATKRETKSKIKDNDKD